MLVVATYIVKTVLRLPGFQGSNIEAQNMLSGAKGKGWGSYWSCREFEGNRQESVHGWWATIKLHACIELHWHTCSKPLTVHWTHKVTTKLMQYCKQSEVIKCRIYLSKSKKKKNADWLTKMDLFARMPPFRLLPTNSWSPVERLIFSMHINVKL